MHSLFGFQRQITIRRTTPLNCELSSFDLYIILDPSLLNPINRSSERFNMLDSRTRSPMEGTRSVSGTYILLACF